MIEYLPRLSVIVCTHNRSTDTVECVEALLAADHANGAATPLAICAAVRFGDLRLRRRQQQLSERWRRFLDWDASRQPHHHHHGHVGQLLTDIAFQFNGAIGGALRRVA